IIDNCVAIDVSYFDAYKILAHRIEAQIRQPNAFRQRLSERIGSVGESVVGSQETPGGISGKFVADVEDGLAQIHDVEGCYRSRFIDVCSDVLIRGIEFLYS